MMKRYNGTLEEMFQMMESMDWKIPAGDTSNRRDHYNISAVAETDDDDVVAIIATHRAGRYIITPILIYEDGTARNNYGEPTKGKSMVSAIENFNIIVAINRKYGSKIGTIHRIINEMGDIVFFNPISGYVEKK